MVTVLDNCFSVYVLQFEWCYMYFIAVCSVILLGFLSFVVVTPSSYALKYAASLLDDNSIDI
jgi:hypothetical protein